MTDYKKTVVCCIFLFLALGIYAQQDTLSFFRTSQEINNSGMIVLGTWAVTNMTIGAFGMTNNTGANKYFHQMNVFWNTVNLTIATYSLISGLNDSFYLLNNDELMAKHLKSEKLFLINAGLDVLYIGAGAFMVNRSKTVDTRQDLLKGYGQSVILQGSFLFVFDLIMYGIQHSRKVQFLEQASIDLGINSVSFSLNF